MPFRSFFLIAAALISLSGCVQNVRTVSEQDLERFSTTKVYYATNRQDTQSDDLNERYNGERAELSFGSSTVAIPMNYSKAQTTPFWHWNLKLKRNPDKYLATLSMKSTKKNAFFNELKLYKNQSALVFIHGFNTPFERANRIAAKMHYDMALPGPFILFSWPSQGSAARYPNDEANLRWSQQDLEVFLTDLMEQTDLKLNLMAHSLGNRALTQALIKLLKNTPWLGRAN